MTATFIQTDDLALWDAELGPMEPLPCDWARLMTYQVPGAPVVYMPDPCPYPASWRVVRRFRCAHGMPFPAHIEVAGLLCGEHVQALRRGLVTCRACGCRRVAPLDHIIQTLERLP